MTFLKRGFALFLFCLSPLVCRAELSPVSLTLFGIYGSPVNPPVLANSIVDGFGVNFLVDWNASPFTSWGLGIETIGFHGSPGFSNPALNIEMRMFPLENERGKFSPYLYGGAGLNLNSGSTGQGTLKFKAGIGSRVAMAGPLYFDLAVSSHWLQDPGAFQYVDFRAGLSFSIPEGKETPHPTPTLTATPAPTAISVIELATPTATPVELVIGMDSAPVTTLAQVKRYYRDGMNAFMDKNYPLSLRLLTKSLASKEIHGAAYYYAETYATIGVIYQFHAKKVKDHDLKALKNYEKALAIDPTTYSAKHYYKKLKAKVAKQKKLKSKKPKPTPTPIEKSPKVESPAASGTQPL